MGKSNSNKLGNLAISQDKIRRIIELEKRMKDLETENAVLKAQPIPALLPINPIVPKSCFSEELPVTFQASYNQDPKKPCETVKERDQFRSRLSKRLDKMKINFVLLFCVCIPSIFPVFTGVAGKEEFEFQHVQ